MPFNITSATFDRSVVKWAIDHDSEVVMSKMLDAGAFAHPRHNVAHILNVALKGRTKIVRLLLEKDLLSADDCETLINQATVYGQIPILQLLRERARLTFPGETVLLYGILSLNNRCVRIPPQSRYGSANSEYRRSRVGKDTWGHAICNWHSCRFASQLQSQLPRKLDSAARFEQWKVVKTVECFQAKVNIELGERYIMFEMVIEMSWTIESHSPRIPRSTTPVSQCSVKCSWPRYLQRLN